MVCARTYRKDTRIEYSRPIARGHEADIDGRSFVKAFTVMPSLARDHLSAVPRKAKYAEAERACQRSLTIRKRVLASDHPDIAENLDILAELLTKKVGRNVCRFIWPV